MNLVMGDSANEIRQTVLTIGEFVGEI